jgi:hypothetical protein
MSHHHLAPFIAIAASLFASLVGAFTAIIAGVYASRRAKAKDTA